MSSKSSGWGGRRRGAGAKPKPADEKRGNRLAVFLTDAQLEALKKASDGEPPARLIGELDEADVARWARRRRK